jgi:hypothetical protein
MKPVKPDPGWAREVGQIVLFIVLPAFAICAWATFLYLIWEVIPTK